MSSSETDSLPRLKAEELQPADVLLSRGGGPLSDLISELDGTRYSHAALWAGDGELIESVTEGVLRRSFKQSLQADHRLLADVYRPDPACPDPHAVVAAAAEHVGKPYGWNDLALAAVVAGVVETFGGDETKRRRLTLALRGVVNLLRPMLEDRLEFVTCSELVATAFRDGKHPLALFGKGLKREAKSFDDGAPRGVVPRGVEGNPAHPISDQRLERLLRRAAEFRGEAQPDGRGSHEQPQPGEYSVHDIIARATMEGGPPLEGEKGVASSGEQAATAKRTGVPRRDNADELSLLLAESAALTIEIADLETSSGRAEDASEMPEGVPKGAVARGGLLSRVVKEDPLELVTPGDLSKTISLKPIGRLYGPEAPGA